MKNVCDYWSLPPEEQDAIQEEADCMTEEEHQQFLNALFPTTASSLDDAMKAAGADGDEFWD
jgi:hypothetical protein